MDACSAKDHVRCILGFWSVFLCTIPKWTLLNLVLWFVYVSICRYRPVYECNMLYTLVFIGIGKYVHVYEYECNMIM